MQFLPPKSDGVYLGKMLSKAILEKDTGTVQLNALCAIEFEWDKANKVWNDIRNDELQVFCNFTLRGRDDKGGKLQDKSIKALASLFGWRTGKFDDLDAIDMSDTLIQFECKTDTDDNGADKITGNWLAIPQETPQQGQQSDPETLKVLTKKYAAEIRAIAANVPDAKPFNPLSSGTTTTRPSAAATEAPDPFGDSTPDDVPF